MNELHKLSVVMFVVACTVAGYRAYAADQKSTAGSGLPPGHWTPENLWHGIDVENMPLDELTSSP
jgi:hypothetical protein